MRLLLPLTLALAACEGGGKSTTSGTGTDSTTEGNSAGTTTGGDPSTSAGTTSTSPTSTSTDPTTSSSTSTDPPVCSTLNEIECALADHCMSIIGDPLAFDGCTPGPKFLFCNELVTCDAVIVTVCETDGLESYQLQNGCIPPGFEPCEPDLGPCAAAACSGLDEQACQADPDCGPILGAPHTTKNGMQCSDFSNQTFLGCEPIEQACPPVITSICPEDQPDTAFDVGGCIPPGFVTCGDGPLPECP